jgi:hypothetical protein
MANPLIENPVPDEPGPMPAMDTDRASHSNLAPQGRVDLDSEVPDGNFTPEGDGEEVPNIPRSENDPIE